MSSGAWIALDDRRSHARAFHATPSEPPPTIGFVMPFFATDGLWCQSCISSLVVAYLRAYGSDRIESNRIDDDDDDDPDHDALSRGARGAAGDTRENDAFSARRTTGGAATPKRKTTNDESEGERARR